MGQLALENLSKQYNNSSEYAVNKLNFSCKEGEFIAILGPSGCGKTTTLRMIAGIEKISSGSIYIDGKKVNDLVPKDRNIGLAFEDYALYPPLNVYENVAFNLRAKKLAEKKIREKVLEISELLQITDIWKQFPHSLSGGQKQRVNIARAIVRQPSILLLDEPMSHLDGKLRQTLRHEIRRLHKEIGCTTILVTHDQLEAMSLADRLVIMNLGNLQQFAPPAEVYSEPNNEFVAEFIGDPPMNIIDADINHREGQYYFSFYGIEVPVANSLLSRINQSKTVRFGIRPDDVVLDERNGVPVSISVFENLGEERRISIRLAEDIYFMISTVENCRYHMNDTIKIRFKEDKIHLFNIT